MNFGQNHITMRTLDHTQGSPKYSVPWEGEALQGGQIQNNNIKIFTSLEFLFSVVFD